MENKQYFTQLEILQDMREAITDFDMVYYDDLLYEAFDTSYYITGRYESEKALEQYGVFDAIGKVKQYEIDSFGEVYTLLEDPEEVATKLYYVLAYETLHYDYPELAEAYDSVLDEDVDAENDKILLDVIDKLIAELE